MEKENKKEGKDRNIVLIGMPYSGKSTLGKRIAKKIGYKFIDTDKYIEEKEGKKLIEILNGGEDKEFKRIEEKRILEFLKSKPKRCIIAPGGSVVLSPNIMEQLKKNVIILYLKISYEELGKRASFSKPRGIVGLEEKGSLKKVYDFREPFYRKYADKIIFLKNNWKKDMGEIIKVITFLS